MNSVDDARKVITLSMNKIRYKRLNIRERLAIKIVLDRARDAFEAEHHMKQYNCDENKKKKKTVYGKNG